MAAYKILDLGDYEFWVIQQDSYSYDVYHPIQKGIKDKSLAEALVRGLEASN